VSRIGTYRIGLKNLDATKARIRTRMQRKRDAWAEATVANAEDDFTVMQSLCPRLTHFMALHMLLEFSEDGLEYFIGWVRSKFVGLWNPVLKANVKVFYPPFVIHGTSRMAGNDFRLEAQRITRPRRIERYRKALAA
jgi:hypothetical protein